MPRVFFCIIITAVALFVSNATLAFDNSYFIGLADSADGITSIGVEAISADGNVVVGSVGTDTYSGSYTWSRSNGVTFLPPVPTGQFPYGRTSVSGDGSVVTVGFGLVGDEPHALAQRWTQSSGWVGLGDVPGGHSYNIPTGVSGDGSIIVGYADTADTARGFRWTESGGMAFLTGVPADIVGEFPQAISRDGSTIVGQQYYDTHLAYLIPEAFRWTAETGMIGLGDLPGGAEQSVALAVSADGQTVVGHSYTYGNVPEAFYWTEATGMVGLGDLPGGQVFSGASGVSGDGSIVVGISGISGGVTAFIWDALNGMRSLQDVLTLQYGFDLSGWDLEEVNGISEDGMTFIGSGTNPDGEYEAWIAHIPEPGSLFLFLISGAYLVRRKRNNGR